MREDALLSYRPHARPRTGRPGAHPGADVGSLGLFRNHAPFSRHPEARRIDLRASLRDPFGEIHVRRFEPRSVVNVYALVDLSASMGFTGRASKIALVEDICVAMARAAHRYGDAFGIIGADAHIRRDFQIRATRRRSLETEIEDLFRRSAPAGRSAAGLAEAAGLIAGRRKLVFILSDFRQPATVIDSLLASLVRHDVVPIVVGDSAEESDLPEWGLIEMQDLETGQSRVVFMRPALRRKWLDEAARRKSELRRLFLRYGRTPVIVADRLDIENLSRQLLEA
ncbi:conserved hypothetical protein [Methylocella silvestris BL2]|uniref:DUF58 domain-containing protein n=1 Tax=Methylocella silvestris (strain DSM 15510 / CIP 108128 / LMG 27833 / NCIMB 13906 / BL2) TaxID=395965 RepID=B8EJP5_METSB|nr:DUF58 domain-containing protein [Methylocella silvestris]ACK49449.1 conserved hypothetical protein [Methylocella silvestris BL2]